MAPREDGRRVFHIDRNGDGAVDFQRAAPDFNLMVKASYWLGL